MHSHEKELIKVPRVGRKYNNPRIIDVAAQAKGDGEALR